MSRHRFRGLLDGQPIPTSPASAPVGSGFMACPIAVPQGMMGQMWLWQQAYQLAFEQARGVLRPSPLDRFAASLN